MSCGTAGARVIAYTGRNMATSQTFNALYRKLNPAQKEAVDAIEGPVMVIAGPGTGKTQILTLRIANILKQTDTPPDAILALTFTESAARSMRRRLVDIIGAAGYRVHLQTFHGFCNTIIQEYPESFPRIIGATNLTDADKVTILKDIITESNALSVLRPFGDTFYYVNPIRQQISELKRENISPDELTRRVRMQRETFEADPGRFHERGAHAGKLKGAYAQQLRHIEKNEELATIYAAYERELARQRLYDYEDMIVETIRALDPDAGGDENLLRTLQEEYHYILADEHQDANAAQNRLLELLASFHESPNLFIVGDEKQAIFRFQGASLANFLFFKERYPDARMIVLEQNYRSNQGILDAAHSTITSASGETELRIPLTGTKTDGAPSVALHAFSAPSLEYRWIADDIRRRIEEDGVEPSEIAVLYRTNRDAEPLVRVFEQTGVPFILESQQNVLADADMQKCIQLLSAIARFGDDEALAKVLHIDFLNIPPLDAYRIMKYASRERIPLYDAIRYTKHHKAAHVTAGKQLKTLYQQLERWKRESENEPLPTFFERITHESGFVPHILASAYATDKIEKLHSLFADLQALIEAHRSYGLSDYLAYLALLEQHNIAIGKDTKQAAAGAVRLMTAHRAKGLEFDHVYIVRAIDGHWGNRRAVSHFHIPTADAGQQTDAADSADDERRLFYVALTRARHAAHVSYARENETGREQLPSQFIAEITPELIETVDTTAFEETLAGVPLIAPRTAQRPTVKDEAFLRDLFIEQGLSVTALNNYVRCPWQYFYRNLLRIPEAPDKHLLFGTAVHRTLHEFFDALRTGEDIGKDGLLCAFETNLARQPLSAFEHTEAHEKGVHALPGYYDTYIHTWNRNVTNELRVSVLFDTGIADIPQLRLRGDIDKIEIVEGGVVNVVDYKTGKPKSRNHILGRTKSPGAGDYMRQLTFYKLLLDRYADGMYRMETGEIDFVEPNDRGAYKKERFAIGPEETRELSETISRIAGEIATLAFWDTRCNDAACRYCALRDMMV